MQNKSLRDDFKLRAVVYAEKTFESKQGRFILGIWQGGKSLFLPCPNLDKKAPGYLLSKGNWNKFKEVRFIFWILPKNQK